MRHKETLISKIRISPGNLSFQKIAVREIKNRTDWLQSNNSIKIHRNEWKYGKKIWNFHLERPLNTQYNR